MEIRSVTLFCEPDFSAAVADRFFAAVNSAFSVPVQSRRVALPPFPEWWNVAQGTGEQAAKVADKWLAAGADFISLGPVQLQHEIGWLKRLLGMIGVSGAIFGAAEIADRRGMINSERCASVARLILDISRLDEKGFSNLYFAALANCAPGSPFFPAAYHAGGAAGFALAVEAADLSLIAIQGAGTMDEARSGLIQSIEGVATTLSEASRRLAVEQGIPFRGIDFSLASFPTAERSLGSTLESLGLSRLGASGSLFAATFVAEALGRADFPRCGFSSLILPVLEDSVLAEQAAAGRLSLADLLSWSAVCGAGLDTVPLPGDTTVAQLTAVLLDVAALATRLDKPLTARLLPLPGLQPGDPVSFDFTYFADSRVMAVPGSGVTGLLQIPTTIAIESLTKQRHSRGE
jgi:uncharacterized protein (UPF0210 family)